MLPEEDYLAAVGRSVYCVAYTEWLVIEAVTLLDSSAKLESAGSLRHRRRPSRPRRRRARRASYPRGEGTAGPPRCRGPAGLAAEGAALRVEQAQAETRHYHGTYSRQLIEGAAPAASAPGDKMLEGARLILEGDAEWRAQAQVLGEHLLAAGQRPSGNQRENHE